MRLLYTCLIVTLACVVKDDDNDINYVIIAVAATVLILWYLHTRDLSRDLSRDMSRDKSPRMCMYILGDLSRDIFVFEMYTEMFLAMLFNGTIHTGDIRQRGKYSHSTQRSKNVPEHVPGFVPGHVPGQIPGQIPSVKLLCVLLFMLHSCVLN